MQFYRFLFLAFWGCLFAGHTLKAQVGEPRNRFSVGVNGGYNFNRASFSPRLKQRSMPGMTAGVSMRYISEKYFSMISGAQLEVNYAQRGWSELFETVNAEGITVTDPTRMYKRTANYVEVPFLAHLAFGNEQKATFFLHLGPQINFLLNESESQQGIDKQLLTDTEKAIYGQKITQKFDYGIIGGAGVELTVKRIGHFLLEGRYYFALSDFYKTTKKDYFSRAAHSTLSVKLSYLFDLTK